MMSEKTPTSEKINFNFSTLKQVESNQKPLISKERDSTV